MKIGITCYPTYGGSGAIATELGIELAARGHEVHFVSYAQPFRLPHFLERVAATERDVASHTITPDLSEPDRAFLAQTLRQFRERVAKRGAPEQLLHGEPHPDNLLSTRETTLFIDFEDVIRGPVEFDLAWVPQDVAELYADADQELVDLCRGIVLAIIATHRWCENDHHPSGRESGVAFLEAVREGPPWRSLDTVQFRRG